MTVSLNGKIRILRKTTIHAVVNVNTDGAALGSPGVRGCGGVFRNCRSFVKGCYAAPLGSVFAFEAELLAMSMAINYAWINDWCRIWLKSDSSYVVQLLYAHFYQVPWCVWLALHMCLSQITHMDFQVSHIFRESNQVAEALSKHALSLEVSLW
ncbi:hypothetical protein Dsin_004479 [Dipteronia sinensis]|uniref:RNase H type-1 domain-containing protein n=1 Tax=Dipteronia sinensis TaxID=43782 RepID=A0AAE0EE94_9ROSI|nr:hypothetical protein Dsin_004479 [Dipteronia sinensis]